MVGRSGPKSCVQPVKSLSDAVVNWGITWYNELTMIKVPLWYIQQIFKPTSSQTWFRFSRLKVQKSPNGVVIETLADGTFRQCEPNGSGFELSADNRRQRDFLPGALSATMDGVSGTESGKWKHK